MACLFLCVLCVSAARPGKKDSAIRNSQSAIVTGASAGIGKECAFELARRGYAVYLAARRADRLEQVAAECKRLGGLGVPMPTDVADAAQVQALVGRAVSEAGRIDVMINNAGFGLFARAHETSEADMRRMMDVNFMGVFHGCRAVAPVMIRQRGGHILNVSSVIGKRGTPFHAAYCASKFAVAGLTESMRVEMLPYNVRVTLVCPALTETEFFDRSAGGGAARSSFVKFKKFMTAQAVAEKMVRAIGRRKPEIVFTAGGKFLTLLSALFPGLVDRGRKLYHDDLMKGLGTRE